MQPKEFPWAKYNPKDGILVVQPVWITEREIQFLMQLYAPFIGREATHLYVTLYGELSPSSYKSDVFSISELLAITNFGMPDFYKAKARLEGIGLLNTYQSVPTPTKVQTYTMELLAPSSPRLFFKDALLSMLLFNQVGNYRFEKLKQRFLLEKDVKVEELKNATFEEAYQAPYNLSEYSRDIYKENKMISDVKQQESMPFVSEVDWDLINGIISAEFVDAASVTKTVRKIVDTLYRAFGLSEQEIAKILVMSADISTKIIDEDALLKYGREYTKNKVSSASQEAPSAPELEENATVSQEKQVSPTVGDAVVQQLILLAKNMPPHDFVTSIKEQGNSFVTDNESEIIYNLVKVSGLKNEVLNILFHYVLVQLGKSTLSKDYVDTIASDWATRRIDSAEAAIELVRNRNIEREVHQKQQFHNAGKKPYRKAKGYQEKLPEWAKEQKDKLETEPKENQSPSDLKDITDRIAKLQTSDKKQD